MSIKSEKFSLPKEAPRLALVAWEDAVVVSEGTSWMQTTSHHEYKPQIFWHVGFIIKDVPEGIHITEAWSPTLVANGTQIPRGMIRSIKYL